MDRGSWWPTVHEGHKESDATEYAHSPKVERKPPWKPRGFILDEESD